VDSVDYLSLVNVLSAHEFLGVNRNTKEILNKLLGRGKCGAAENVDWPKLRAADGPCRLLEA
jgi:hypothetical protein